VHGGERGHGDSKDHGVGEDHDGEDHPAVPAGVHGN